MKQDLLSIRVRSRLQELMTGGDVANLTQFTNPVTAGQYAIVHEQTLACLDKERSLLDWGCGNGHFSFFLAHTGRDITAYGFEENRLVEYVQEINPSYRFVQGSPEEPVRIPFADSSFDGVFSIGVLEHVPESGSTELKSLQEIVRILKPGGKFFCFHLPNKLSWIEKLSSLIRGKYYHRCKYTRREICRMVSASGLALLEARKYGFLPRNMAAKLPGRVQRSRVVACCWNGLDRMLSFLLHPFCQNWYFIAQKAPGDTDLQPGIQG